MAYEPQHILEVNNIAIGPNKQNAFGTPMASASFTQRPRTEGTNFAQIQKTYYSDEQKANKGHQWPMMKQQTQYQTAFDATWDLDSFLAGWLLFFTLGAETASGAGPYTHTLKFLQSTNQMPVTTLYFQDTADILYQMPDLAISSLQISGKEMGPISAQFKMVGSGKYVDGAVSLPPASIPTYLLGSDTDILLGTPAPGPALPVLSAVVSGALALATYFVRISYVTAGGETIPGPEASIAIPANSVPSVASPPAMLGATGWNVYISTATGTETKQNVGAIAIGTAFQVPPTGLIAGAAMPSVTTALTSIKERVRQWDMTIAAEQTPNRAPGGGMYATFMKVLKQRATVSLQVSAKDTDDIRTLFINDTMRELQIVANSGAAAQLTLQFPGIFFTAQLAAQGVEEVWNVQAGDQDVIKNGQQEVFQAKVINSQSAYGVGA